VSDGAADIQRAAEGLASRLPDELAGLARLAYNYRWSWMPDGAELFRDIDPQRWELDSGNPVRLLAGASAGALARAAHDEQLLRRAAEAERQMTADLARPARRCESGVDEGRPIAFFCAEYAVHASLPIYSGGLGALAGDLLKQASDQAMPQVAIGLMYRQGYFRQRIDAAGWQHEYWIPTDPDRLPAALVTGENGRPLTVAVPVRDTTITAQIWRVQVGRVALFLLDSDRPENDRVTRWITSRLYVSDAELRLAQYALLGVGGVRALRAMGLRPALVHLNEGHAAFAALELARPALKSGASLEEALRRDRPRTVFTTHTPVPAGNDSYPVELIARTLGSLLGDLGVSLEDLARLGRSHPDQPAEPFGVTQFALRTSDVANAVSRRHGDVARQMWRELWPARSVCQVPITHVTNGVHVPTWLGTPMRRLLDRYLSDGWTRHVAEPELWQAVAAIPAAELWSARREQRARLVDYVRNRSVSDRLARGDLVDYAEAAARTFDPDTLTIGFARRLATYKRMRLLISDWQGSVELLRGERPIQVVLAGKAHPRDDDAKRRLQELFATKSAREVAERVVFLDDYDLDSAALLVQGCDVWVNLPRPPLEASGTSGMKAAVNGGLHLSVLDGWWAEAYDGTNGWALPGEVDPDHEAQDARDGAELRRVLADEVVPAFHRRDERGVPQEWIARIRSSMRTLVPTFSAQRMLDDYVRGVYRHAR
jgi:starch phosphorylase